MSEYTHKNDFSTSYSPMASSSGSHRPCLDVPTHTPSTSLGRHHGERRPSSVLTPESFHESFVQDKQKVVEQAKSKYPARDGRAKK